MHQPGCRTSRSRPPEGWPRERAYGEDDRVVLAVLHDEELLAGLGVTGQGAVGEAAAPGFVDGVDDDARRVDAQPADAESNRHVCAFDGSLRSGNDPKAGAPLDVPTHHCLSGPLEVACASSYDPFADDMAIAGRQLRSAGRADFDVRRGSHGASVGVAIWPAAAEKGAGRTKKRSTLCLWASDRPLRGRPESLRRRDRRIARAARARAGRAGGR